MKVEHMTGPDLEVKDQNPGQQALLTAAPGDSHGRESFVRVYSVGVSGCGYQGVGVSGVWGVGMRDTPWVLNLGFAAPGKQAPSG